MTINKRRSRHSGSAIITALLILALIASISTLMLLQGRYAVNKTRLLLKSDQNYLQAEYQYQQALQILSSRRSVTALPPGVNIIDCQSRFNLNNLVSENYLTAIVNLLFYTVPDVKDPLEIISQMENWVSPVGETDYDAVYHNQQLPYRVAHRPLIDLSELRLVHGISQKTYQKILPYVIALPPGVGTNVNTASPLVLQALGFPAQFVTQVVKERQKKPYTEIGSLLMRLPETIRNTIDPSALTTESQYFLIHVVIEEDKQNWQMDTLVKRVIKNNSASFTLIWRTRGAVNE